MKKYVSHSYHVCWPICDLCFVWCLHKFQYRWRDPDPDDCPQLMWVGSQYPLSLPGTSTTPTTQFRSDQQRGLPVLRSSPSATWAELTFSGWSTDLDTFPHSYLAWRAPVFDFPPGSWSPRCFSSPPRPSCRLCLVHRYPGLRTPGTELPGTRPHTPPEIRSWLLCSKPYLFHSMTLLKRCFLMENIAKGTTDPRVEFSLPKYIPYNCHFFYTDTIFWE